MLAQPAPDTGLRINVFVMLFGRPVHKRHVTLTPFMDELQQVSAGLSRACCLQQTPFRHGQCIPVAGDHVVQHADVDQRQRRLELLRENFVRPAWSAQAARVVVMENDRRRIHRQRLLHHLAWIHRRLREAASEQALVLEKTVVRVQVHHREDFMLQSLAL